MKTANIKITKDRKHDHFWIKSENLFESFRFIADVNGLPDNDNCKPEDVPMIIIEEGI